MKKEFDFADKLILIAENDETNFVFYKEAFRKTNAKILWAKNGKQAVDIFKENPNIDLIIMDIQMPLKNGYEATSEIKKIKNVPIIVLTAFAMKSVKQKCIDLQCDEFITKPVKSRELLSIADKTFHMINHNV
ncbi:MAG: hypothetical protein Kow0068_07470 [Marinilabiliales bacterium]